MNSGIYPQRQTSVLYKFQMEQQPHLDSQVQPARQGRPGKENCLENCKLIVPFLFVLLMVIPIFSPSIFDCGGDTQGYSCSTFDRGHPMNCSKEGVNYCCRLGFSDCEDSLCVFKPYQQQQCPWVRRVNIACGCAMLMLGVFLPLLQCPIILKRRPFLMEHPPNQMQLVADQSGDNSGQDSTRQRPETEDTGKLNKMNILSKIQKLITCGFISIAFCWFGFFILEISIGKESTNQCSHYYPDRAVECLEGIYYCCQAGYRTCGEASSCEVKPDDLQKNISSFRTMQFVSIGGLVVLAALLSPLILCKQWLVARWK